MYHDEVLKHGDIQLTCFRGHFLRLSIFCKLLPWEWSFFAHIFSIIIHSRNYFFMHSFCEFKFANHDCISAMKNIARLKQKKCYILYQNVPTTVLGNPIQNITNVVAWSCNMHRKQQRLWHYNYGKCLWRKGLWKKEEKGSHCGDWWQNTMHCAMKENGCLMFCNSFFFFPGLLGAEYRSSRSQYFIEKPINQTVIEGDNLILKCQVGNLQGAVQWTRNGFAMGKLLQI